MTIVWSARSNGCVDGELREDIQYYHRICAVTIVSSAFPIPLGIRFQRNGETEVACTLSLLQDLLDRVGRRFLDLLVADALYLQTPFARAVEDLGLDWVINLKDNQPELLAEAQRLSAGISVEQTLITSKSCSFGMLQKSIGRSQTAASL